MVWMGKAASNKLVQFEYERLVTSDWDSVECEKREL